MAPFGERSWCNKKVTSRDEDGWMLGKISTHIHISDSLTQECKARLSGGIVDHCGASTFWKHQAFSPNPPWGKTWLEFQPALVFNFWPQAHGSLSTVGEKRFSWAGEWSNIIGVGFRNNRSPQSLAVCQGPWHSERYNSVCIISQTEVSTVQICFAERSRPGWCVMFITGSVQSLRASRDCLRLFHLGLTDTSVCFIIGSFSWKKKKKKRQESLVFFGQHRAAGCCRHATRLDCWFPPLIWILVLVLWSRCCCLQILQRLSLCRGLQWWVCGAIGLSAQNPGGLRFVWCGSGPKPLGSRLIGIHSSPHPILLLAPWRKGKKMRSERSPRHFSCCDRSPGVGAMLNYGAARLPLFSKHVRFKMMQTSVKNET